MSAQVTATIENRVPTDLSNHTWHGVGSSPPAPDTAQWHMADTPPVATDGLVTHAAEGAHATIDRLADSAALRFQQVGDSLASAENAVRVKTDQIRDAQNAWSVSLRSAVQKHPLACVAGALAVGALIYRATR